MNNLSKKILQKIKTEKIKPKSRFYFYFKNITAWFLTITSLVFSSFLTSALIFVFSNRVLIPMHILNMFILIDIVFLFIAVYLGYHHFHLIRNSYRARLHYVVIGALVTVFTLSFIFVQFRLYGNIDSFAQKRFSRFSIQKHIHDEWSRPKDKGMLAGEVVRIDEDGFIYINDFKTGEHKIDPVLLDSRQRNIFLEYLRLRMVGFENNNIFYPDRVEPWEFRQGPRGFHPEYKRPLKRGNLIFPPLQK